MRGPFRWTFRPTRLTRKYNIHKGKKAHCSNVIFKISYTFPSLNSGCRPRFVNAELDPGGRGKELVGKGLDTVRARLATVRARLVILNKICENLINEIPLKKVTKKLKSPSNLHEKSFRNLSDLEKKSKRIPFKMNSLYNLQVISFINILLLDWF